MKKIYYILALTSVASLFLSCSKSDPEVKEDIPLSSIELPAQTKGLVSGGNLFGYKLLKEVVEQEDESFMISPLSLIYAVGIAAELPDRYRDDTPSALIGQILGNEGASRDDLRSYCSVLSKKLPVLSNLVDLCMANILVYDSDAGSIDSSTKDAVLKNYDASIENVSFGKRKKVVELVNNWSSKKTNGMVKNVLSEFDVRVENNPIYANASYFKGEWKYPFEKGKTKKHPFTKEDGEIITVDMMSLEPDLSDYIKHCWAHQEFEAVQLPYGNRAFNMTIYLPMEGYTVADVAAILARGSSIKWSNIPPRSIEMPRFSLKESKVNLTGPLSKICPGSIPMYKQISSIRVDESGTEAAVVTIPDMLIAPSIPQPFKADHPFIFTITEQSTGVVLYAGVYRG